MTAIYTVVCREGEHEYSWRNVDAFFDKATADTLCANAQARHDELRKRFPGNIRLGGLNQYDPANNTFWEVVLYYVQTTKVSAAAPEDLAQGKDVQILEQSSYLPLDTDYFRAPDVDLLLGERTPKAEHAAFEFDLYDPVTVLQVGYRGLTFSLNLQGGLVGEIFDDAGEGLLDYFPVPLQSLTEQERGELVTSGEITRRTKLDEGRRERVNYAGALAWECQQLEWFREGVEVVPGNLDGIVAQFIRVFEVWLQHQVPAYRNGHEAMDADLKAVGL